MRHPNPALRAAVILLAAGLLLLAGCGSSDDDAPVQETTTQRTALVPGSVADQTDQESPELPADIPPEAEALAQDPPPAAGDIASGDPVGTPAGQTPPASSPATETPRPVVKETTPPPPPPAPGSGRFSLQLGSYTVASFAEAKAAELRQMGHAATVEQAEVKGQLYHRVFIRGLADRQSAENLGEDLRADLGLSYLVREKK